MVRRPKAAPASDPGHQRLRRARITNVSAADWGLKVTAHEEHETLSPTDSPNTAYGNCARAGFPCMYSLPSEPATVVVLPLAPRLRQGVAEDRWGVRMPSLDISKPPSSHSFPFPLPKHRLPLALRSLFVHRRMLKILYRIQNFNLYSERIELFFFGQNPLQSDPIETLAYGVWVCLLYSLEFRLHLNRFICTHHDSNRPGLCEYFDDSLYFLQVQRKYSAMQPHINSAQSPSWLSSRSYHS